MAPMDPPNVVLPSWRGGRLLFFTSLTDNYSMRLEYRVAAATMPGETTVKRTFKAPISAEQLAKCQETADNGPELQKFFHAIGRGNLDSLALKERYHLPPCAAGSDPLIYICSYFDFLRKYSVDQALVSNYENLDPAQRFQPESSLFIYKTLSAHLQTNRAIKLISADIPDVLKVKGAQPAVANLLREVAVIQADSGSFKAAIEAMKQAAKLQPTEDKWRRLGDFAFSSDQPLDAIAFFTKAENLSPLAPPPALRMARLLIEAGRAQEAAPFLDRAEKTFPKPVEALRAKIAS